MGVREKKKKKWLKRGSRGGRVAWGEAASEAPSSYGELLRSSLASPLP